jgi:hypothetical protein
MGQSKELLRSHVAYLSAIAELQSVAREWSIADRSAIVRAAKDWVKAENRKAVLIAGPLPTNRISLNHVKPPKHDTPVEVECADAIISG